MVISLNEWLEQGKSWETSSELTPHSTNILLSSASVSTEGLVMNLRFEENAGLQAIDSSPNGTNPGYLRNGASFGNLNDPHEGVIRLDGLNDYLRVASSNDLNLTPQSKRTISLWLRVDDTDLSGQKQVLYEEGGGSRGLSLYIDQGTLYVGMWVANQWITFLSTPAIEANRWQHVALVLDAASETTTPQAGAIRAYLDGQQFGQGSGAVLPAHSNGIGIGAITSETRFHDGVVAGTGSQAFGGSLDDLRVYNRALSASEINALADEYNVIEDGHNIGINLAGLRPGTSQLPFLDAFQYSTDWIWTPSTPTEVLNLDEDGWIKSLPTSGKVQTTLFRDELLSGTARYVVLYEGEGTITYSKKATKNVALSSPGRDVIDINFDQPGSVALSIIKTDPNENGNYIRNIDVVPEAYETTYQTEIFTPKFVETIDPFSTLRFMDWGATNHSPQARWSDRATLDEARWSGRTGVPLEMMVELSNRTQANPWFNIPHLANNEYITNFAQYVKENLDPSLTIYVEYSNEVWNSNFQQYKFALNQARLQWPDAGERTDSELVLDWYSQRTAQMAKIWDQVFGEDKERVLVVVNSQSANIAVTERILSHSWDPNPKSSQEYGIDGLAIAPYFGRYLGLATWESQVQSWTQDPDGGLNKLFDEITEGGVLRRNDGSPAVGGGALEAARTQIINNANIAQQEGLLLLGAEGGQSIKGVAEVEDNNILANLFIQANRDPRMEAIYEEYFEIWKEEGGDLINHFSDIYAYRNTGSWGALEYLGQDGSPKYNALIDLINGTV